MATARAAQKPPQGQKMPPAGLCLKKQPLSTRTHKEKCRHRLRPASGAPVFANGAVTSAMAFAFNQVGSSGSEDNNPDFSKMSNQEITEWMVANQEHLGIEVPEGVSVRFIDSPVRFAKNPFSGAMDMIACDDSLCGGKLIAPIDGAFHENQILLFPSAFKGGNITVQLPGSRPRSLSITVLKNLSRVESAIQTFGHEAAHARGIDVDGIGFYNPHPNAEQAGVDAVRRFQGRGQ